jgi:hypothetical protein
MFTRPICITNFYYLSMACVVQPDMLFDVLPIPVTPTVKCFSPRRCLVVALVRQPIMWRVQQREAAACTELSRNTAYPLQNGDPCFVLGQCLRYR